MDEEVVEQHTLIEEVTVSGWVFQVTWTYTRFTAEFVIWRAESVFEDGSPSGDWEEEMAGHVDWGGCLHLNSNSYVHLCNGKMLQQFCSILNYVYDRGQQLADA